MEIELDARKSARANLQDLYALLRQAKEKRAGLVAALAQTERELGAFAPSAGPAPSSAGAPRPPAPARSASPKSKAKRAWHSPYLSFLTSGARRVAAGRDAKQNDELAAKHLSAGDLFFHADIQGAPTVVLKDGQKAGAPERLQAAQFAASFSSAWKTGVSAVDVYAVRPEQVGKHAMGGYVGRGAFAIEGEREWFRQTPLSLRIGWLSGHLSILPAAHPQPLERSIALMPGPTSKEEAARTLSARLSAPMEDVARLLPAGKFSIH